MLTLFKNRKFQFLLKLVVSAGLLVYLAWIVDWPRAVDMIGRSNRILLAIGPLCWLAGLAAASVRWQLVLADSQVHFRFWPAFKAQLLGVFYSIFLPGAIGGDVVRIGLVVKQTKCRVGTATASILLERIAGVFALLMFVLLVHLFFPATFSALQTSNLSSSLTMLAGIGVVGMLVGLLGRRLWLAWLPQNDSNALWRFVRSALQTVATLKFSTSGFVLILSALFQGSDIIVTFLFARAIGLTVPLSAFFVVIPLVYLATVLPISLGGLGVREGTLVFLLAQFGLIPSDAVTLSFLVYINRVVIGALGGLVQLLAVFTTNQKVNRSGLEINPVIIPNEDWS